MVFAVKSLIGALIAGTGALIPVAVNKVKENNLISKDIVDLIEKSSTFKGIKERDEINQKNIKISKALKQLQDKKCQLLKNPQNQNSWFDALYGCKEGANKRSEFYYLGSVDSFTKEKDDSLIKKVISVSYKEDSNNSKAYLSIKLEGNEREIDWNVTVDSVWKYFKDVNLSEKCTIVTPRLGKDVLSCVLKGASNNNETFYYSYAVF